MNKKCDHIQTEAEKRDNQLQFAIENLDKAFGETREQINEVTGCLQKHSTQLVDLQDKSGARTKAMGVIHEDVSMLKATASGLNIKVDNLEVGLSNVTTLVKSQNSEIKSIAMAGDMQMKANMEFVLFMKHWKKIVIGVVGVVITTAGMQSSWVGAMVSTVINIMLGD